MDQEPCPAGEKTAEINTINHLWKDLMGNPSKPSDHPCVETAVIRFTQTRLPAMNGTTLIRSRQLDLYAKTRVPLFGGQPSSITEHNITWTDVSRAGPGPSKACPDWLECRLIGAEHP
ncbi:hypothetical protein T265_04134 [Opisthorchis viverrini]|uniref:Uncharacterized protein n=1 Tax=Opisthorchis viverrini TaxID=6198 RepID=A0A075A125_OPIVI|nr:hypothetical protein T265_04134 [Opisthorchis viverrini]KER29200.1 hypothetical protein T265_04134 [Opisthorchis viverrini]